MDLLAYVERLYGPALQPSAEAVIARLMNDTVETLARVHRTVSWGDRLLTLDKVCGFRREPEFARAMQDIRGSHPYDQYDGPDGIAWRLNTLVWAARCALQVGGDFVECGVFKGDMSWVVLQAVGSQRIPKFYLFDSFEGFSPQLSSAEDFPDNPGFLDFANRIYREAGLFDYVRARFSPYPNIKVIKGFLPEAFAVSLPERIAYLHVDLNSPRAEIAVLERLFDRVVAGGVIVFDDYGWALYAKQKEAEDAFMRERGYHILELPSGQGLVVKR